MHSKCKGYPIRPFLALFLPNGSTYTPPMPTDTSHRCDRRLLRFNSIAEIHADLVTIESARFAGTLRHVGHWPAGPLLEHLGHAAACSFDGFDGFTFPLWLRMFAPLVKTWMLRRPFPTGFKLNKSSESKAWKPGIGFQEGLAYYRTQLARVETSPGVPNPAMTQRHPSFGLMTPAEWVLYQLRHAELHLGFLRP